MRMVLALSSLRLTLAGMLALAVGVLVRYFDQTSSIAWMVTPQLLLALNLMAAMRVNPVFRAQPALMLFHVCLLAVVLLAAASQLGSLQGRLELTEGQAFSADAVTVLQQGPWHSRERLARMAFEQGSLRVRYNPGLKRSTTESSLVLGGEAGNGEVVLVGDNTPLKMAGYRLYTTSNKGFSAILLWRGAAGEVQAGAVNFPSYPVNDWQQLNNWTSPNGQQLGLELMIENPPDYSQQWVLDSDRAAGALRVTVDGRTLIMNPGDRVQLGDGVLQFVDVRMWMGYAIRFEPLLPWLFGVAVLGVLALAWYFRARLDSPLSTINEPQGLRVEDRQHAVPVARF